ncbi:uncharacterized protein RJT20DRAFT_91761 [Scheffersomyces xylosifermentans]|uniref:uncharacterized protein n=1 Tax=Scheffersomyces xylosifermentans TaxID=1304137 RepID=UPI00315C6E2D
MNESPIMRRCKDDWVNATQILKCCNFPKAKRTKILEKGVQQGLHEKVQGGFGRFQGTWIPLPDAQRLAQLYGVTAELAPVLYLDLSDPNLHIPQKAKPAPKEPSQVKRKYTKKAKKPEDQQQQQQQQQMPQTFTQADFMAMNGNGTVNQHMPMYTQHNQAIQNEFQNYQMQFQRMQQQQQQQQQQHQQHPENPQKYYQNIPYGGQQQQQPANPSQHSMVPQMIGFQHNSSSSKTSSQGTNEATNWSQDDLSGNHKDSDTSVSTNEDPKLHRNINDSMTADITQSPRSSAQDDESYSSQLLKFFSEDNAEIPYFVHNPPYNFNINEPIDDEGHTPLHWAASIGNCQMIHILLAKGASPLVVNNLGLNPLSKLISFNNCFELKNFPKVLDDLELCLINTDINGRTPLHYLSQFAKVKTKYESLRYYLNIILNKLTSLSNSNTSKQVDLLRNVLDHQDVNGDTCLHLAVKSGCAKIARSLRPVPVPQQQFPTPINSQSFQASVNKRSQENQQYQVLATPVQPPLNGSIETPDTQRTTIQDDDMDEEDTTSERIDRRHLDYIKSEDNKENIFVENHKGYDAMSTPIQKTHLGMHSNPASVAHQPLAVITERTVESTPIRDDKKLHISAIQQTHKPRPPKLDENGNIVEEKKSVPSESTFDVKLSMNDLSSMITGMINSLSDSYSQQLKKYESERKALSEQLESKNVRNEEAFVNFKKLLNRSGLEQFSTIEEGKKLLFGAIKVHEEDLQSKEHSLLRVLERDQAFQLAALVEEQELKYMDIEEKSENSESNSDLVNQDKFDYAIELTNLQLERSRLMANVTKGMKMFGIDSKMYKYRKLLSLSCGLKVEDIDSLIDGIEESLVENTA